MTRLPERPDPAPITSPRSDRVRRIAALSGRSARRRTGLLRVDGPQAVPSLQSERAADARELFLTETADAAHPELRELAERAGIRPRTVAEEIIRAMARSDDADHGADDVATPQGAIAVAARPADDWSTALGALPDSGPLTLLVLAEVRDPGNVGTLVRAADAAGADLVVLSRASADPWGPKAIRASAGSAFHLPVVTGAPLPELLEALAARGIAVAATSGHADADLFELELPGRLAWVMGNEARGVDEETLAAADLAVRIPLAGRAESLNVATAATVCLFETLRRRHGGIRTGAVGSAAP